MTPIFSILFIMAVVISTALLIIILISQHTPRQLRNILLKFKHAAAGAGVLIEKQELIGKRVIGVDAQNGKLLFYSKAGKVHDGYFVDLYDIESVEVNKDYGLTFDKYSRRKFAGQNVSKIYLHLLYKNGGKQIVLPFYDIKSDAPSDLSLRFQQAKEWRDVLTSIAARDRRLPRVGRMSTFRSYLDAA